MDIGSIFLILAMLILVALFVSRPFLERGATGKSLASSQADHDFSALLAERDRVINALQELDFDFSLGKIPEEDYPGQRNFLLQKGADILRELDGMQVDTKSGDAEARIEAAIAARRADARRVNGRAAAAVVDVADAEDDLEVLLANRRRSRQEKSAGFCPQCGGPVQKSDRFCPKCGATLA